MKMKLAQHVWDEPENIRYVPKGDRQYGIGGTDLAGLLYDRIGYKYATPLTVYCEKMGMKIPKKSKEIARGIAREYKIKEWLQMRETYDVAEMRNEIGQELSIQRIDKPWLVASLDGIMFDNGILKVLEIKTTNYWQRKKWYKDGGPVVPEYYEIQVQWYMHLSGIKQAMIVVEIDLWDAADNKTKIKEEERYERFARAVPYKEKIGKYLEGVADRFWFEHIESKIMPKSTGEECEKEYLKKYITKGETLNLQGIRPEIERLYALQEEKKAMEKEIENLKGKVQEIMREHSRGACKGYRVDNIRQERRGVDQERLRTGYPDAWKNCQKTTAFKSLKISKEKDNE